MRVLHWMLLGRAGCKEESDGLVDKSLKGQSVERGIWMEQQLLALCCWKATLE